MQRELLVPFAAWIKNDTKLLTKSELPYHTLTTHFSRLPLRRGAGYSRRKLG